MILKTYLSNKEKDSYEEIEVECEIFKTPIIDFAIFQKNYVFMAFEVSTGMAFGVGPHETFESCKNRSLEMIETHGSYEFQRVIERSKIINQLPPT